MYSSGIVVLAVISSIIVVVFRADEIAMLPLYALGVMLSFTLSQAGMSRLMSKVGQLKPGETAHTDNTQIHYERTWRWKKALNVVGSITTGVVFYYFAGHQICGWRLAGGAGNSAAGVAVQRH